MPHGKKGRRKNGATYSQQTRYYTTDTGWRFLFDLENAIDTGEDREAEDLQRSGATRQTQQVIADLLNSGLRSQGISPKQWVGYSGNIEGYRLSKAQSMSVFNAAIGQEFLTDDSTQAHSDTEDQRPLREEDEPFGPWDFQEYRL